MTPRINILPNRLYLKARSKVVLILFGACRDQIPYIPLPVATPLLTVPPTLAILNAFWFSKIVKGFSKAMSRKPDKVIFTRHNSLSQYV